MAGSEDGGVEAVERAFQLLECFDAEEEPLSLAELARRTGFYKSTILRIAVSMDRFGYMQRLPDGRYQLGATLWRLGSQYQRRFDLEAVIRRELELLVEATSETASYYVREGDERICLYRLNSPRPVRHHLDEGRRLSLDSGASSKVLRAFSDSWTAEDEPVRAAGRAESVGERDPDVAAVAVPLFDRRGAFLGALAVSGLAGRFDEDRRAAALAAMKESADRLARLVIKS